MKTIDAIILAAGAASRFRAAAGKGAPSTKLAALYKGAPMVRRVAAAAAKSRVREIVVVTGHARADVEALLADMNVRFVHNADFASGMASSLRCGVEALAPDCDGALVLLGDMPRISTALINEMIDAGGLALHADAVVPVFAGKRGNPALIGKSLFGAVARLDGDRGARALFGAPGIVVAEHPCSDEAVAFDVDTPDALRD